MRTFLPTGLVLDRSLAGPLWPGSQADIDTVLKQLFGLGPDDRDAIGAAIELHYAATLLYDVEPPNAAYALAIAGLEHLSRAYGAAPVEWPDSEHADRLDKVFLDLALTSEQSERLRAELLLNRHLRLRQTFATYHMLCGLGSPPPGQRRPRRGAVGCGDHKCQPSEVVGATAESLDVSGQGEARLHGFLVREHCTGRQQPAQLLAKLRRAPAVRIGELELATRRQLVLSLVATITAINGQIKQLQAQIATAMRERPDGAIFLSLFKQPSSVICAAELLAEIGDCRARYPTRDTLAADAGQAAVAIESGKRKAASFRWACNKCLRGAVCTLADTTRHHNPWAQDLYASARGRGHDHPRAIRTLGRAWCRIVWRCWQDGVPYDPARHRALQQHITVTIPTLSGPVVDHPATQRMLAGAFATAANPREQEVTAAP
jgi:hypothetical protein